jgi:hypothetical protein
VGLRADEETREGIYSEDVASDFPLRRWGWGLEKVVSYLKSRDVRIPERTDCARCFGQRLIEWKRLWAKHPPIYAAAARQETIFGYTFRSPGRDTWPASLEDLAKEFASGRRVRGEVLQQELFDDEDSYHGCRVCRL